MKHIGMQEEWLLFILWVNVAEYTFKHVVYTCVMLCI